MCNPHSHLREGDVVGPAIEHLWNGGVETILPMPNTQDGLTTAEHVLEYVEHAKTSMPDGVNMQFIPCVMITESTTPEMVNECISHGIKDAKVYPLNRTTKSHNGVRDYFKLLSIIQHCGEVGMRVHFHPEHPWMAFNNREAEHAFLPIIEMFVRSSDTQIIWEHGTDARCIPFWKELAKTNRFYVTLTAHHLATDEDKTFGDVRATCKPSIKRPQDMQGLVDLVREDHSWVMAGADDAPHDKSAKHTDNGPCACGAYTAPFLLPLYAHALDDMIISDCNKDGFQRFVDTNARDLYGLQLSSSDVELERNEMNIHNVYTVGHWSVMPFWANQVIKWSFC
ncbi:hypothetical protein N9L18_00830 [Candidatus Pacebacteria bacterium]|nr:hypothetical protein [Candidatus Paceibacterota bacterium]